MRRNELTIVLSLAIIGLIVAVWLVVLAPKRDQAASLKQDVDQLQSQLEEAQQAAAAGAQEQKSFPADYRKLVVLGKAVPEDGDQASLLVQLQQLADRSGVGFQSIDLADAAGSATTPAPAPATTTSPTSSTSTSSTGTGDTSTTSTTSPMPVRRGPPEACRRSPSLTPPRPPLRRFRSAPRSARRGWE